MKSATVVNRDREWERYKIVSATIKAGIPWQFILFFRNILYTLRWGRILCAKPFIVLAYYKMTLLDNITGKYY